MLNPDIVRQQISNLKLQHPELLEDEDAWLLSLESETDTIELLRRIERRRQEAEAFAQALGETMGKLADRQARFERQEEAMRDLAFGILRAAEMRKAVLPEATMSIAKGRISLAIPDAAAVPDEYCRIKKEPDKTAIRDGLESGAIAPNWATLVQGEPTISIRVK